MPILANAKKALRVSQRKAVVNQRIRSRVRTLMKKMQAEPTQATLQEVFSAIDRAAKKNLFHKNKAARLKAQMNRLLKVKK